MNILNIYNCLNIAYIDPSSVSILITSISGIVIALGATIVILWRKAKKSVAKTLHIDENAHKEVEGDVVLKDDISEDDTSKDDVNKDDNPKA